MNVSKFKTSEQVLASFLSGNLVIDDQFTTDAKTGYQVRMFTADFPCTRDEINELLRGNRVVMLEDVYRIVGKNVFRYMLEQGYIRAHKTDKELFWVTKRGADAYGLPRILNAKFPE